jgi:predicted ATP-grasp superfamily ATP-dependent carboligase
MGSAAPGRTVFLHEWVTGGGMAGGDLPASWAAEGGAMRRALAEDFAAVPGVRVLMALDHRLPDEPGPWQVARIGPGEEEAAFARLAAEADWTLCIAPETGGILTDRARTIERVGGRSLGSSPGAIALAGDKLRLGEHLARLGLPTPPGRRVVVEEGLPRDAEYPAVLKPIDGAGSIDTFFLESAEILPAGASAMTEALLQPFVPGEPMSASFLVGPEGEGLLVGIARQRIERRNGRFSHLGGVVSSHETPIPIDAALRAVEGVMGLRGWVGVDFVWDAGRSRITIIEINPRPTTSYVGWRRLYEEGGLARAWLGGFEAPAPPPGAVGPPSSDPPPNPPPPNPPPQGGRAFKDSSFGEVKGDAVSSPSPLAGEGWGGGIGHGDQTAHPGRPLGPAFGRRGSIILPAIRTGSVAFSADGLTRDEDHPA